MTQKRKDNNENARTNLKMQGQKGKGKDDIKETSRAIKNYCTMYIQKGKQICNCSFGPFGQSGQY